MACSKFQYVKQFQQHRVALLDTYLVARIDGRAFTKFCELHNFTKPNDIRTIKLMNDAARELMIKFPQIILGYGQSDEYSFAFPKQTKLFNRRIDKIETCLVSYFTASFVIKWKNHFGDDSLNQIPSFDCRIVQYPNIKIVKDYFRWRQVDCHINNLYNTVFWCMVQQKKMKTTEVEEALKVTNSANKNEMLFQDFGINYNNIEPIYRKGTILSYKIEDKNPKKHQKLPVNIRKELAISLNQLKALNLNMNSMKNKLKVSGIQEDQESLKELEFIDKELLIVEQQYTKLNEVKSTKILAKSPKNKYQLTESNEDMINEQFWELIKLQ